MQIERDALELAAVQAQHVGKEADGARRGYFVPFQPPLRTVNQVLQVPLASVSNVGPGGHLSGNDRLGVCSDRIPAYSRSVLLAPFFAFSPLGSGRRFVRAQHERKVSLAGPSLNIAIGRMWSISQTRP
jgi:hypothetical protein